MSVNNLSCLLNLSLFSRPQGVLRSLFHFLFDLQLRRWVANWRRREQQRLKSSVMKLNLLRPGKKSWTVSVPGAAVWPCGYFYSKVKYPIYLNLMEGIEDEERGQPFWLFVISFSEETETWINCVAFLWTQSHQVITLDWSVVSNQPFKTR